MVYFSAIIADVLLAVQDKSGMSGWFKCNHTETFERKIAFHFFDIAHESKLN